jgi:ABC-type phosphate/phosphonate transport system substrate-binding protein
MAQGIRRRSLAGAGAIASLAFILPGALPGIARAQAAPGSRKPAATPQGSWRLLVNEAFTGENNNFVLTNRYKPLADFIGARQKGRAVSIEPIVDVERFLELARAPAKPDFIFGKSVNQLAKLVRDQGYQPVAHRADPYKAAFIVGKDSHVTTLEQASRAKLVMPDEHAATSALALAELRKYNTGKLDVTHIKFQEAVAQQVKSGLAQVGVVNPTVAKKWAEEGGRVVGETQPVVNWSLLAAPSVPAATVLQLQAAFVAMTPQETDALAPIGVKQWVKAERQEYLALLKYTGE